MTEFDFLDAQDRTFDSEQDFIEYIDNDVTLSDLDGKLNIIGSVNDYPNKVQFEKALSFGFEPIWKSDDLRLLVAHTDSKAIPYYVYLDDEFPLFFTTANITDEMPPTIEQFLQRDPRLGRFWLSMEQMELLRQEITSKYDDLIIPFFTGHRSKFTDIPAEKREDLERTMSYWARDGRQVYKEMRSKYGILPKNILFERPNHFKFGIKQEGVFKHRQGSVKETWNLYRSERERKKIVKKAIDTGGYDDETQSILFEGRTLATSRPWGIETKEFGVAAIDNFESRVSEDRWEFGVSAYKSKTEIPGFDAHLIDSNSYVRTKLRGRHDSIRIYPDEDSGIDQHIRIYNLVQDHFDPSCKAIAI